MNDPFIDEKKIDELIIMCKNRLDMSYYKYGSVRDNIVGGRCDPIGCIDLCLEKYRKTKNTEYMLDIINYALFKVMYPWPGDYFKTTDSSESAGVDGTPINLEKGDY